MELFIGFSDRKYYIDVTQLGKLSELELNQDDRVPLKITFLESSVAKDMTGWTVTAGFVGGAGKPTGTAGSPALAGLTASLAYNSTDRYFSGMLDCNTDETISLLGNADRVSSVFAVRATLPNGDPLLVQRIQALIPLKLFAAAIEDTSAGGLSLLRATPVGLTVSSGQVNSSVVVVPGVLRADLCRQLLPADGSEAPAVKRWIVNENPDDSDLNTLECELVAPAATNVTIYAEIIANG